MRIFMKRIIPLIIVVCSITFISCNETLPLREDIASFVTVKVRSGYRTTSHSNKTGTMLTFVTVTNNTDETIEDIAAVTGTVEITWIPPKEEERLFDRTRTFKLSPNNVFYAKNFDRLTSRLTMAPADSVVFYVDWNLKTNDSTYILNYFAWMPDNQCFVNYPFSVPRRISTKQTFLIKANVKIFDRLAVLYTQQVTAKQCFMLPHAGEANSLLELPPCTDFIQFDPCSAIGQ